MKRSAFISLFAFCLLASACQSGGDQFQPARSTVSFPNPGNACDGFLTSSPQGGSNVTLSGTVVYEDKPYNSAGFTGTTVLKPVRYADVEAVRCADSVVLGSGKTNALGGYTLNFSNGGSSGVYIRVLGKTQSDTNHIANVTIMNNTFQDNVMSIVTTPVDDGLTPTATADVTATAASRLGGLFNILDNYITAGEFLKNSAGIASALPLLTVYWEANSTGTFFDPSSQAIFVSGANTDQDEYDDDVVLHEFGHYVASNFSKDDSPGGQHTFGDSTEDVRLAWSEGWATFFSAAVRNNGTLVDNSPFGPTLSFSLETYDGMNQYTTNETAVAAVLWDAFDTATSGGSVTEASDNLSGFGPIWSVVNGFNSGFTAVPISMDVFWDNFGDKPNLRPITAAWGMKYSTDGLTATVTAASLASQVFLEEASFYSGDGSTTPATFSVTITGASVDQTFTISSVELNNGADPLIEVFDLSVVPAASAALSDNGSDATDLSACGSGGTAPACPPNDASSLSSVIALTAPATGNLRLDIRRSATSPPSSGHYGGFQLRITSP